MRDLLIDIGFASFAGIINIFTSWQELDKRCRFLPFFKPFKTAGFWLWLLIEFISPMILFRIIFPFSKPTNLDPLITYYTALSSSH